MARLLTVVTVMALLLVQAPSVLAQAPFCAPGQTPTFDFGFAALKDLLGPVMGDPLECAHANPENGDTLQQTSTGLAYWQRATNTPTFTTGFEHWALTAQGFLFWTGPSVTPPPEAVVLSPGTLAPPPESVGLQLVAEGLVSPVALVAPPDGSGRRFIVDQAGLIRVLMPDGTLLPEPFLDVRDRMIEVGPGFDERGRLGLAFHPDFAQNGRFFIYYSAPLRPDGPQGFNHTAHISELRVSAENPNLANPASERLLLQVDEPQANHNGGTVAFGPDGFLYISLGDGGGANDVGLGHVEDWYEVNGGGNGQDTTQNLLGNILRIDVNGGEPYGIPADNPFVGGGGLPEIFAYGFRNPYRFSFDRGGQWGMLAADAGQNLWEEVSQVVAGGNYGWNVREGTHCFSTATPRQSLPACPDFAPGDVPLLGPVIEYPNAAQEGGLGLAVVGGFIYRGGALPGLVGRYVFADWSRVFDAPDGSLFFATPQAEGLWPFQEMAIAGSPTGRLGLYVMGLAEDASGELYVMTKENTGPTGQTGRVFRIVAAG